MIRASVIGNRLTPKSYYINHCLATRDDKVIEVKKLISIIISRMKSRNSHILNDKMLYISPFINILGYDFGIRVKRVVSAIFREQCSNSIIINKKNKKIFGSLKISHINSIVKFIDPNSPEYIKGLISIDDSDDVLLKKLSQTFCDDNYWLPYSTTEHNRELAARALKIVANTNIKCRDCGGGVMSRLVQSRSVDEGETCYYGCVECGKRWKK